MQTTFQGNEQFTMTFGSRCVRSNCQNSRGLWQSRLYVNGGETATLVTAKHKTIEGARKWAKKTLAPMAHIA